MSLLPWTIYLSFAGALLALVAGARSVRAARWVALVTAAVTWVITLLAALDFKPAPGLQTLIDLPWISQMGIRYHLAAAYAQAGRKKEALAHLDFALQAGTSFSEQPAAQKLRQALAPSVMS